MSRKTYEDGSWEGCVDFLHTLCNKAMQRVKQWRLPLEYDDLFQEASIAFVDAKRAFNPDRGTKFITYVGCAVSNRLNKVVSESIASKTSMMTISLDDQVAEDHSMHEQIADNSPTAEDILTVEQTIQKALTKLSPLSRKVIEWVESPPQELRDEFRAYQERCRLERERFGSRGAPRELDTTFIVAHFLPSIMNLSRAKRDGIHSELKRFAEYASA